MGTRFEGKDGPFLEGTEPSPEAVSRIAEALRQMREDGQMKGVWPEELPYQLHSRGYLEKRPHYLEVLAALTEAGIMHALGDHVRTGEDLLKKYIYEERIREVRQRREVSARRRRDFEQRGLSAEESDRLARYLSSVGSRKGGQFSFLVRPHDWEPPQITKEEAEEIYWGHRRELYANYLRDLEEYHQAPPETRLFYPGLPHPLTEDNDKVETLLWILYEREQEQERREEERREQEREERRRRLKDIRSPEELRAYEQEFALGASSS